MTALTRLQRNRFVDVDGDGSDATVDCNDNDASIYPGATEIVSDEIDQNCDGLTADRFDGTESYLYTAVGQSSPGVVPCELYWTTSSTTALTRLYRLSVCVYH